MALLAVVACNGTDAVSSDGGVDALENPTYRGAVFVEPEIVGVQVIGSSDPCYCGLERRIEIRSCTEYSDTDSASCSQLGCPDCVGKVSLLAAGAPVDSSAMPPRDGLVSFLTNGVTGALEFAIEGCGGELVLTVPDAVVLAAPTPTFSTTMNGTDIEWSPAQQAEVACIYASFGFSVIRCCGPDNGALSIPDHGPVQDLWLERWNDAGDIDVAGSQFERWTGDRVDLMP